MKKKFAFLTVVLAHIFSIGLLFTSHSVQASSLVGVDVQIDGDSPGLERSEGK